MSRQRIRRIAVVVCVSALACAGLVLGSGPAGAVPTGFLIIEEDNCQLNGIDLATGDLTPIGGFTFQACVRDLALAPDGTLYGLREGDGSVELMRFDTSTGAVTNLGQIGTFGASLPTNGPIGGGLVVDQAGRMFAAIVPIDPAAPDPECQGADSYCLYRVDPTNPGATTFVGQMPDGASLDFVVIGALAATCDGAVVTSREPDFNQVALPGDNTITIPDPATLVPDVLNQLNEPAGFNVFDLANVDPATAVTTTVGSFNHLITGIDFDSPGVLWGVGIVVGGPTSVFTIDRATGAATPTVALEDEAFPLALAIPKTCPGIVVEPTFTG